MGLADKIAAVGRMQKYIVAHLDEDITLDALAEAAGYSKYHAIRIFKELTGWTPFGTIRAMRLTKAAQSLQGSDEKVVDVALDSSFDSHDGFTRAFRRQFGIAPQKYQRESPAVRWFISYPIEAYYRLKERAEPMPKEPIPRTMTVTAVERPARKLILLRSVKATMYCSFCEEMGCDWEGLFNSIPEKFDTSALLTLPPNLIKPGTGNTASGVEVPMDYVKPIPGGCDVIDLPPCIMLYFQGAPFEDDNDFGEAIGTLWEIMAAYDPTQYGWQYAPELAPYFNFGAAAKSGAKMARPVKEI
ncbi:MAG: helix-turn-helix transcriptional regulator [Anaerolineales bacterium]|nr:helix-turn-helix transcriptional regulator [Anaerolineales bacterium]